MRFLVDNQLPPSLAKWLRDAGHDARHVGEIGMDRLDDRELWSRAIAEDSILVSKDEDFLYLANQSGTAGKFLWVRLGDCRNVPLIEAFTKSLAAIEAALESGQRVVELI